MEMQLNYGNWIRVRILLILGLCALGLLILGLLPLGGVFRLIVMILFAITLISFLIPFYSYVMFSQRGGRVQDKVYNLIIQCLGAAANGRFIDIGSGNGVLAVKLALQHTGAEVLGIDYWGEDWEYSQRVCEENARVAHVEDRVSFQKGDAAALDFPDNTFDGATSNLTFHEVRSVTDKRAVVQEALRVVKTGGSFAFVDYFYEPKYYGEAVTFECYLEGLKLSRFELVPLRDMMSLPLLLRHPKVLGRVGILYGVN